MGSFSLTSIHNKCSPRILILAALFPQMCALLEGKFSCLVESFVVVDCRYPYEYQGGHIKVRDPNSKSYWFPENLVTHNCFFRPKFLPVSTCRVRWVCQTRSRLCSTSSLRSWRRALRTRDLSWCYTVNSPLKEAPERTTQIPFFFFSVCVSVGGWLCA